MNSQLTNRANSVNVQLKGVAWQAGLSLIELMIAMTLGLLIIAAVTTLFVDTSRTNSEMAKMNAQIENGRFAIQIMQNEIMHAGYWGGFVPEFDDLTASVTAAPADVPTAIPDPCPGYTVNDWQDNTATIPAAYRRNLIGIPVEAYAIDGSSTLPANCGTVIKPTSADLPPKANTDVLVVRHADTRLVTDNSCNNAVCFQASRCETEISAGNRYRFGIRDTTGSLPEFDFNLTRMNCNSATLAEKRKFISTLYWVRSDNTLMRSQLSNGAVYDTQPLIDGIEAVRVEFGIDNKSDNGNDVDYGAPIVWANASNLISPTNRGDGAADQFVRGPDATTVDQLANVVVVKLYVLARADKPTPGYTDSKSYNLGTATVAAINDNYKRHVFSTVVRLNNISGRRETP